MKCPKCGSKDVQGTNVGKRVLSTIAGVTAAFVLNAFTRNGKQSAAVGYNVKRNICEERTYICLNPNCKHIFSEKV